MLVETIPAYNPYSDESRAYNNKCNKYGVRAVRHITELKDLAKKERTPDKRDAKKVLCEIGAKPIRDLFDVIADGPQKASELPALVFDESEPLPAQQERLSVLLKFGMQLRLFELQTIDNGPCYILGEIGRDINNDRGFKEILRELWFDEAEFERRHRKA